MTVAEITHEIQAEQELADRLSNYAGRWVAVRDHEVVADAETLDVILEQFEENQAEDVSVFQVATDGDTACFF